MKTSRLATYGAGLAAGLLMMAPLTIRAADVEENWTKNCVSCHGKDGKGETRAGKKAGVKDMTDADYQAKLTDEKAIATIKEGIKEEGEDTMKMKAFADKLTDDEIKALVAKVRTFKP